MDNLDPNAPQAPAPEPAPAAPAAEAPKAGPSYGSIIGIVLIVAVLVGGALYVWGERIATDDAEVPVDGVRGDDAMPEPMMEGGADASIEMEAPMPQ